MSILMKFHLMEFKVMTENTSFLPFYYAKWPREGSGSITAARPASLCPPTWCPGERLGRDPHPGQGSGKGGVFCVWSSRRNQDKGTSLRRFLLI